MKNCVSTEFKFWKLALRETYYLDLITQDEMIKMHSSEFFDQIDYISIDDIEHVNTVFSIMKSPELFASLLKEEVRILSKGKLPDDKRLFRKMWLSYLLDCLDGGYINRESFDTYVTSIDFDTSEWRPREQELAKYIIEMLQFILVQENINAAQFIENPSFELLMYVNDLEYV